MRRDELVIWLKARGFRLTNAGSLLVTSVPIAAIGGVCNTLARLGWKVRQARKETPPQFYLTSPEL